MKMFHFLRRRDPDQPGFVANERGTAIVEFVIVFPMLVWALLGIFLFWDVFRAINLAQKSSFTLADNLSRADSEMTTAYIDGLSDLLGYLSEVDPSVGEGVRLRVSSLKWNMGSGTHEVAWSYSADSASPVLTTAVLPQMASRLPTLTQFETVILVETEVDFVPALSGGDVRLFTMGVGARTFTEFVVIRPRFLPKICLQNVSCA